MNADFLYIYVGTASILKHVGALAKLRPKMDGQRPSHSHRLGARFPLADKSIPRQNHGHHFFLNSSQPALQRQGNRVIQKGFTPNSCHVPSRLSKFMSMRHL